MEILDKFRWTVNSEQFQIKCDALTWPFEIKKRIDEIENLEIESDIELDID